ncbi:VOC family protein [Paenibacillus sp. PR3]|uniref:VOC family protein n=1 Tax=Paenibacillus terricola TaxID=2763503 RepID=A0ABR8MYV4_9BACL|nr:VOC family protein [Paenibacillus terricola]MBD3921116.1 VOC family protein [Paenibacillus terricola]
METKEPMVMRLDITIPVSDQKQAVDFYVKYLDCEIVWWLGPVLLRLPNKQEILIVSDHDPDKDSIWYAGEPGFRTNPYYSLQVVVGDKLEEFRNRLLESGVVVDEIHQNEGAGKSLRFFDPSGNRLFAVEW